ncbi:hypothetical protein R3W88_026412 [Solanum pinnatisectum]|uniref:Uncharacterized protein n=1 Tax=Solanum pinnatisectum TaxID=50273 RepID=A0AAV9LDR7_9SOLN|nr:hypothetical protein R3W88_026412 [Solanum pinnatisectum]
MASVIEQCQVAPPPGGAAEVTLPLTYFDHVWLGFHHTNGYPELRYVTGDSISVTFSETDMDFNYLIGDHPRNAKDFYHFVPKLGEPKDAPGVQLAPVLAIQVTLYPNLGVSIGFTNHHVVGDGATIVGFIRAWALLHKFGGHEQFLSHELIPFYDRSVVKDPDGQGMSMWEEMKKQNLDMRDIMTPPEHKVRGTFTIKRDDIEKLKNLILNSRRRGSTTLTHVTSFTVTSAYVWTCLIKSGDAIGEEMIIDDSVMESFGCAADFRARFNPPLPQSYFGNCIVVCFNLYDVDFGWGRPEKIEIISIDNSSGISMSISKYKDSDGDLEVGWSLPKTRMSAFVAIFDHGLSFL